MAAVSLAILGKDGEPLYIKEFRDDDEDADGGAGGGSASKAVAEEELFGLPAPPASASFDEDDGVGAARGRRHQGGAFDCSVRQQFILHAALDRFDQLSGPPPGCAWRRQGATGRDAMFAGLLCPVEDLRVYGKHTFAFLFSCALLVDSLIVPKTDNLTFSRRLTSFFRNNEKM